MARLVRAATADQLKAIPGRTGDLGSLSSDGSMWIYVDGAWRKLPTIPRGKP